MSLHGLTSITPGVPDVGAVESYYEDFGLRWVGGRPGHGLVFATTEGSMSDGVGELRNPLVAGPSHPQPGR